MRKKIARHKPKYNRGDRIADYSYKAFPEGRLGTIYSFLGLSNTGEEWYSVHWDHSVYDPNITSHGSAREKHFKLYEEPSEEVEEVESLETS